VAEHSNPSGKTGASENNVQINLKDPALAAFLAWLIPGGGHFYQGRTAKAVLFLTCILGTFSYGMFLSGGRCVYAQFQPPSMRRYSFLCQLGVGLPALPAVVGMMRHPSKISEVGSYRAAAILDEQNAFTLPFLSEPYYMPPTVYKDLSQRKYISPQLDNLNTEHHRYFELGTVFTMIAGLLNLLAVYDAWRGPAYSVASSKEKAGEDKDEEPAVAAT